MAPGADPGSPDRGNGSTAASHGRRQHVDHANQEPHGHALDRCADDPRGQDLRPRPRDHPADRPGHRARARAAPGHGERIRRAVVRGALPGLPISEMDQRLRLTGAVNTWTMPIKNRTDMLSTGVRTTLAVKIFGPDLETIQRIGQDIERALAPLPGTASVYAERSFGGRYLDIRPDADA